MAAGGDEHPVAPGKPSRAVGAASCRNWSSMLVPTVATPISSKLSREQDDTAGGGEMEEDGGIDCELQFLPQVFLEQLFQGDGVGKIAQVDGDRDGGLGSVSQSHART